LVATVFGLDTPFIGKGKGYIRSLSLPNGGSVAGNVDGTVELDAEGSGVRESMDRRDEHSSPELAVAEGLEDDEEKTTPDNGLKHRK
jgi:hypothetical protein